jgi:hypothetical protein
MMPWRPILLTLLAAAGLAASITLVFLAMRAVMDIGGACADGGPYVSAQPCPDGVPLLLIAGMFGIFLFGGMGLWLGGRLGGWYGALPLLGWPALFLSLGWNFIDYGIISPPPGEGIVWGWLIPGVVFLLMGGIPLALAIPAWRMDHPGTRVPERFGLPRLATVSSRPVRAAPASAPRGEDLVARLERLAALRDRGDLTEDEFETAKRAVIDGARSG